MRYRIRIGCPWRDLPDAFGPWRKLYKRFNAWCASGKWLKVFEALVIEPDVEWVFIDDSKVFIGDKGDDSEAIGNLIQTQGAKGVIPRKRNSIKGHADVDKGLYRDRHLVENAFARLKQYRIRQNQKKLSRRRRYGLCHHVATNVKREQPPRVSAFAMTCYVTSNQTPSGVVCHGPSTTVHPVR